MFKRILRCFQKNLMCMQLQVRNNTSVSQVGHKYITRVSQISNKKVRNGYSDSKVTNWFDSSCDFRMANTLIG